MAKKLFMAADHAGIELKSNLGKVASDLGFEVIDLGTNQIGLSVDYPDFANLLAKSMQNKVRDEVQNELQDNAFGLLICGSGIGISIAANRHSHIRAALCHNELEARLSRQHNHANVIVFGARLIGQDQASASLRAFLTTEFEGGRHQNRIDKMS